MKNIRFFLFVLLIFFFASYELSAHSGRTNSEGCHNNRKTGGYHCHNTGYKPKNNPTPNSTSGEKNNSNIESFKGKNNSSLVREIQTNLKRLKYYDGKVDGVFGQNTMIAIVLFQNDNNLETDGEASRELLEILKKSTRKKSI